ncbi:MAG TPA: copper chaperone PCu(A)C [Dermatophilaceae bacterium]|nr:copper chaperone PCu(A)C [Dermatophilaceae bacterium]
MTTLRILAASGAAVLSIGLLSGCASDEAATDPATTPAAAGACPLTVADPWVKAQDKDMTGAFGVFTNPSDVDITITEASSPQAGMMEIHEVVDKDGAMVMQPKEGGLVVPAGGEGVLKPGSDHLMLMKLPAPIEAGDEVEITVVCDTGGSVTWTSVAKPFEGGAESYVPAEGSMASMSPSPKS